MTVVVVVTFSPTVPGFLDIGDVVVTVFVVLLTPDVVPVPTTSSVVPTLYLVPRVSDATFLIGEGWKEGLLSLDDPLILIGDVEIV